MQICHLSNAQIGDVPSNESGKNRRPSANNMHDQNNVVLTAQREARG
jgi:hypothetical protein